MNFEKKSIEKFGEKIFETKIPSDRKIKRKILDKIIKKLYKKKCVNKECEMGIRLSIDEALVNAITHGNKDDLNKKVKIQIFLNKDRWGINIEDEGDGFKKEDIPDPSDPETLLYEGGRGILLIRSYMDEVHYYDNGRKVFMVKNI